MLKIDLKFELNKFKNEIVLKMKTENESELNISTGSGIVICLESFKLLKIT